MLPLPLAAMSWSLSAARISRSVETERSFLSFIEDFRVSLRRVRSMANHHLSRWETMKVPKNGPKGNLGI